MAIFRVTLKGSCVGQDIINVLYYRTTFLVPGVIEFLGGAAALAAEIKETIWDNGETDDMRSTLPNVYTLASIEVDAIDNDGVALTDTPYVLAVGEAGGSGTPLDTTALCALVRFNLEPAFGPGFGLPRGGYIALGPLTNNLVGNDSIIPAGPLEALQVVADAFAANIETEFPPALFFPCRIRYNPTGLPFPLGYRDIQSASIRPLVAFRRSRLPTG